MAFLISFIYILERDPFLQDNIVGDATETATFDSVCTRTSIGRNFITLVREGVYLSYLFIYRKSHPSLVFLILFTFFIKCILLWVQFEHLKFLSRFYNDRQLCYNQIEVFLKKLYLNLICYQNTNTTIYFSCCVESCQL